MGVASGMPVKSAWLPLLVEEMPEGAMWQTILIGRDNVWPVHRTSAELGGHLRTGLEDTFYLPDGSRATSNGQLIEALAKVATDAGREIASPQEALALVRQGHDSSQDLSAALDAASEVGKSVLDPDAGPWA